MRNDERQPGEEIEEWFLRLHRATMQSLHDLHGKVNTVMATEAELQALVEGVASSVESASTEITAAVTELTTLEGQIAALTAGQPVTQEQLDAMFATLSGSKASLDSSNAALTSAVEAAQAPPAPPAGGTEPPPPPSAPSAPTKPVYQHLVGDAIDETQWGLSGFETAPTDGSAALPLYYFAGDVDGGGATGAVEGVWQVYTGAVQAAPAA